jgi:ketosteroid isomerase-like protein
MSAARATPDSEELTMSQPAVTQSDAEILKAAYAAFSVGDVPGVLALFDEQITFHVPGANLISGDYRGHQEVVGFFAKLAELSAGTVRIEVHEIFDNDSRTVVALATIHATRGGAQRSFATAQIWGLASGRIVSYVEHYGDEAAMNAFWS